MNRKVLKKQLSGVIVASLVVGSVDLGSLYAQASTLRGQEISQVQAPTILDEERLAPILEQVVTEETKDETKDISRQETEEEAEDVVGEETGEETENVTGEESEEAAKDVVGEESEEAAKDVVEKESQEENEVVTDLTVEKSLDSVLMGKLPENSNRLQGWDFNENIAGWYYGTGWDPTDTTTITYHQGGLKITTDYSHDIDSTWNQRTVVYETSEDIDLSNAVSVMFDLIYNENAKTTGSFKFQFYTDEFKAFQDLDTTQAVDLGDGYYKVSVNMPIQPMNAANIQKFAVQIVGHQTDYQGDLWLDNVQFIKKDEANSTEIKLVREWTFENDTQGWDYDAGWNYQYSGTDNTSVIQEDGRLKMNVDYSKDKDFSWSKVALVLNEQGMNLTESNKLELEFYYEPTKLINGSFKINVYSRSAYGSNALDATVDVLPGEVVDGLMKSTVVIGFDALTAMTSDQLAVCLIGVNTDYTGALYLDNMKLSKSESQQEDIYVNSTEAVTGGNSQLSLDENNLTTGVDSITLSSTLTLVDDEADQKTQSVYAYLEAIGKSKSVIYGHQNDTWHKAGSGDTNSDTKDVTGSISGIVGIDTLSLVGDEYSAKRYNTEIGGSFPENVEGNVSAAAALTNLNIKDGAIMTLSAHMPNFSLVKEVQTSSDKSYAKYDFSGYTPGVLTGDVMNQILPGGEYHEVYKAYLDLIADYAHQVDGTILFRPFHENTGSWFWWGAAFCDAETYKNVYRYTVEYLRDEQNVHNFIYVYGPGSEASTLDEYAARYPGDDYIDMVGFDMYDRDPDGVDKWMKSFKAQLELVGQFAKEHGKLLAVTETGVATSQADKGDNQTALHKTDNKHKDWYNDLLDIITESEASYFLLWANFGQHDGFYTPYVVSKNEDGSLYGHEMLDNFINFYNKENSVFAINQQAVLEAVEKLNFELTSNSQQTTGYFVSPISGNRILKETILTARITGDAEDVVFKLNGNNVSKELTATISQTPRGRDGKYYDAVLDTQTLELLGEHVGTIELVIGGKVVQTIGVTFNIPEPEQDIYQVDGFENYYGVDNLLNKSWATNKESGSTIKISLTDELGKYYKGNYGMKFEYMELENGWAGATIAKEVDWSNRNALQFWTIPDGNNQKVVVQITANKIIYEVYLNQYVDYRDSTEPMLVTIPFSEFCERDTAGNPKGSLKQNSANITSFGLWVNAVSGSDAMKDGKVEGAIYYDEITAIQSDVSQVTFDTDYDKPEPTPNPEPEATPEPTPNPEPEAIPEPTPNPDSTPNSGTDNGGNNNNSSNNKNNPNHSSTNKPQTGVTGLPIFLCALAAMTAGIVSESKFRKKSK